MTLSSPTPLSSDRGLGHLAGHAQSLVQPTERATACRRRPGDVAAGTCLGDPSRRWRCRRRVLARCPFRAGTGPADGVVPDVVTAPAEPASRDIPEDRKSTPLNYSH